MRNAKCTATVIITTATYISQLWHSTGRRGEQAATSTAIESPVGMLMLIYQIDGDRAFDVLRWRSQQSNVKVRLLAEQISADFRAVDHHGKLPERAVFDHLLLTAHERVSPR
jgi:ANTAR domain